MLTSEKIFVIGGYLVLGIVYIYSITGWQRSSLYSLVDFLSDVIAVIIWPVIFISRVAQVLAAFIKRDKGGE